MIRSEFKLIAIERRNLSECCIFAAHIYIPAWIACPMASDAPVSDVMLIMAMKEYTNMQVSAPPLGPQDGGARASPKKVSKLVQVDRMGAGTSVVKKKQE